MGQFDLQFSLLYKVIGLKLIMAHLPKMSLVAQYDDLCRYTKVLTAGPEEEFRVFVENQYNGVRKWKEADSEVKKLRGKISSLENENGRLETKIKHLKNLLQDTDSFRRKIEWEKNCLAGTIAAVKDVILADGVMDNQTREKLAFLNSSCKQNANTPPRLQTIEESTGTLLSPSEFDETDDDLETCRRSSNRGRRSKGKRSSSDSRASKKKRLDEAEEFLNRLNKDAGQQSSTEPTASSPDIPAVSRPTQYPDSTRAKFDSYGYKYDQYTITGNTPVSHQMATKHVTKNHQFVSKKVIKSAKCLACRQNIGYLKQYLKCQVCGVNCHPECVKQCPLLCFPIVNTPTKGTAGKVSDYTSSSSPMIPPLIVHCIREIEARGFREVGLYRVSASDREVRSLREKFVTSRIIPNLNDLDIHSLCVAVKEFLRSLEEPLITRKSWQAFVDAANLSEVPGNSYAILGLVKNLPQPNRDTLAFLILHWQKITESPYCKMDNENLAKVLGPTVVGYSTAEPSSTNMLRETTYQYQVMKLLLSVPSESWRNILSVEENVLQNANGTPENLPAPKGTRLGPIYASVQKRKSLTLRKTPLTPRNSKSSRPGRMEFASPLLK